MRHLLIAFLLAIFSVQGAVVAVGEDLVAAVKAERRHAALMLAAPDALATPGSPGSTGSISADEPSGSMIEELSDYLPPDLIIPQPVYPAPARPLPHVTFLSIDLPRIEPPPRA